MTNFQLTNLLTVLKTCYEKPIFNQNISLKL